MPGLILLFLFAYLLIAIIGSAALVLMIVRPARKTFAHAIAHGLPTEPGELGLGLDADEVTFNLPDRHTSPGWIITGQDPAGPTVLVLHGHRDYTCGALRFVPVLAPFASSIVVFDWPGHGGCTAPWMTCGTREPGDAIAVLDGLPQPLRDKPIVLFGYSLGGQIAIKTAGRYPDRFAGLVVDGAYRRWDTPIRMKMKAKRVPSFPFIQLAGLVFYAAGLIRRFDRADYAKRFAKPTLVLHGTDDRICPIEEGKQLADAAPDSTFVAIQGGRHNQLHEQEPEQYRAALEQFFKAIH
ncbi:MAG: alpha/beta fold hydrolase [Phycisphaeraceae bacterium]